MHHNLFYNCLGNGRNPNFYATLERNYSSGDARTRPDLDARYNVIAAHALGINIDSNPSVEAAAPQVNIVSNLFIPINDGNQWARNNIVPVPNPLSPAEAYIEGNASVTNPTLSASYCNVPLGNCLTATSTNSYSNSAEFDTPAIAGPGPSNRPGRLAEWAAVKAYAGLIGVFADDATDAATRAAISIPTSASLFGSAWNQDDI
jgi:hypothetical protein